METKGKKTFTTRFGAGPDDEDITIEYYDKEFEVKGIDVAGPIIYATDGKLDPETPQGAKLLVNANAAIDRDGFYVFRDTGTQAFDIAIVEHLEDGTHRYTSDKAHPQIITNLSQLNLVGRVWEIQILVEIDHYDMADNGTVDLSKKSAQKAKVWWPVWTDDLPPQK